MWLGVPCRTKYESSLGYKSIYNCAIPHFIALIITGPKILEDPENNQTNLWFKRNPIVLNRIMLNVWSKQMIDLRSRKTQQDKDVGFRPTNYKARKVNKISDAYSSG